MAWAARKAWAFASFSPLSQKPQRSVSPSPIEDFSYLYYSRQTDLFSIIILISNRFIDFNQYK